jgi:6-phosphogluconolactonase/glucosamine-6-phosphate isomerase/deaminase
MNRIRWCLVDERNVSPEDLDRNDSLVWNNFLKPLGVIEEKFLCFGASVDALEYSDIIGTPDMALFGL